MMQPNRSTAAADEHRSSDARHQAMIFGSGHRLSREAYDDLSGPHALSGVTFFQALMHTALALEEQRAGLLSAVSRTVPPSPVELLRHWLDLHALGHLVLLAFRDDRAWFADMLREVGVTRWTPTHALIRERVMSIAVRGAWAVGELGEIGLQLYLPLLRGLNGAGDCAVAVEDRFSAVLLLSQVVGRTAGEFYAPQALIPAVTKPWTVEVGVDVLRRSIPNVGVSGSTSLN